MMRHVPPTIIPLGCVALLSFLACRGEGPAPAPSASASPTSPGPAASPGCPGHGGRWATIVLYQRDGACRQVSGPVRFLACRGEDVTWRIYNYCREPHTVTIDGFVRSKEEPKFPSPKEEAEEYKSTPPPDADPNGPFEPGEHVTSLRPDEIKDLKLRVRMNPDAAGFYRYYTILDGKRDADQQIEVP